MKTIPILSAAAAAFLVAPPLWAAPGEVDCRILRAGDEAPNLQVPTLAGESFDLKQDLRGKVVLLDFWATWCGPCVAETPNIKRAYDRWHEQGFEVVAISLDRDLAAARRYVEKQGLEWFQVGDGLGFRSPAAQAYGIKAIPQLILLGRDGRVLANNTRGPRLHETLERAMNGTGSAGEALPPSSDQAIPRVLREALAGDDREAAAAAVRTVISDGSLSSEDLAKLAFDRTDRITDPKHPEAIYLMTKPALDSGTVRPDEARTAGIARGHAAIALGGPYVAVLQLNQIRRIRLEEDAASFRLRVHLALATGELDDLGAVIATEITKGRFSYREVNEIFRTAGTELARAAGDDWAGIRYWMKAREGLPADRASLEQHDDLLVIRYRPAGTPLAGALRLQAEVEPENGVPFAVTLVPDAQGVFTGRMNAPGSGEVSFRDPVSKRRDTNEGRSWRLPQDPAPAAE